MEAATVGTNEFLHGNKLWRIIETKNTKNFLKASTYFRENSDKIG